MPLSDKLKPDFMWWLSHIGTSQASILPTPYPGCRALVREAFSRRGVSEATKNIMLASLSENTMKQYNTYLKYWFDYCLNLNINYLEASVPHVLCFFDKIV
ncbi:unnamed protein product [Euphydryas editha]|uniref:Integrase SAM-like N-terminal domain-containing protein n=1 Tax=Euphydryas editha TaxID=104508 RepID=A0AAU9VC49_EUPED|nr:unnamed protein product [Euphydryas editha]